MKKKFKFEIGDLVLHKTQNNKYNSDKPMLVTGRGNFEFDGGFENVYCLKGVCQNANFGAFVAEIELKEYPEPQRTENNPK